MKYWWKAQNDLASAHWPPKLAFHFLSARKVTKILWERVVRGCGFDHTLRNLCKVCRWLNMWSLFVSRLKVGKSGWIPASFLFSLLSATSWWWNLVVYAWKQRNKRVKDAQYRWSNRSNDTKTKQGGEQTASSVAFTPLAAILKCQLGAVKVPTSSWNSVFLKQDFQTLLECTVLCLALI